MLHRHTLDEGLLVGDLEGIRVGQASVACARLLSTLGLVSITWYLLLVSLHHHPTARAGWMQSITTRLLSNMSNQRSPPTTEIAARDAPSEAEDVDASESLSLGAKKKNNANNQSNDDDAHPATSESLNTKSRITAKEDFEASDPPLPNEAPPESEPADDGWQPLWDENAQAFYFYNKFTGATTWTNPRVPEDPSVGIGNHDRIAAETTRTEAEERTRTRKRPHGGYDPSIHGDYDPTAAYARETPEADGNDDMDEAGRAAAAALAAEAYAASGAFNRFTGKWQQATLTPENFNDENKSRRQMSAFFDVDAAANSHDGKSLKAERSGKKLSKKEVKAFKDKRRTKKEEKRRAWLRD